MTEPGTAGPIFIGGLMRSGTTLLRAMLGQHRAIAAGLETHWFDLDVAGGVARKAEPLEPYVERLAAFFGLEPTPALAWLRQSRTAEDFLDKFMAAYAAGQGKPRWAEKTPGNIRHVGRILAHWPAAQVVHIVRDPRDVFASFRRSGRYGGPADYGALWCDFFADAAAARAAHGAHVHECRYEALVRDPESEMRRLLDFLGEPWDPAAARFEGRPQEFEQVRALTGHESTTLAQLAEPLRQDRVGGWAEVLSQADVDAARAVCADRGLAEAFDRVLAGATA